MKIMLTTRCPRIEAISRLTDNSPPCLLLVMNATCTIDVLSNKKIMTPDVEDGRSNEYKPDISTSAPLITNVKTTIPSK